MPGEARRTYCGFASEPVPWSALDAIFVSLFGDAGRDLQKFPDVIGGTWARWTDGADIEYDAANLDDVKEAYSKKLTKRLSFSSFHDIHFSYSPGSQPPYACLEVRGSPEEVDRYINVTRGAFPLQRKVVFVSWSKPKGLAVANRLAQALRARVPAGTDVFVSDPGIAPGSDPFKVMLQDHLRVANAHVVVVTAEGYQSPWVTWEAATSWARRRSVIPIFVDVFPHDLAGHPLVALAQGAPLHDVIKINAAIRTVLEALGQADGAPLNDDEIVALTAL